MAVARAVEGALAARSGRCETAELALREARLLLERQGSAFGEAFAIETLANLLTVSGRIEEAHALLGEGLVLAERAQLRRHALVGINAAIARNRLAAGALHAAEDATAEARILLARHGECAVCRSLLPPTSIGDD
jgi:hypothetical protein